MTPQRMRAIAQRCVEDMDAEGLDGAVAFVEAAIETALEEAGRPVGVDLRDRFAVAIIGGLMADSNFDAAGSRAAEVAYRYADAMLAARQRPPVGPGEPF